MNKFMIFVFLLLPSFESFAQADAHEKWLKIEKLKHYEFVKNFTTREYICETKVNITPTYDKKLKKWYIDKNNETLQQKKFLKIIKSDDIKSAIPLCGENNSPQSDQSNLNKYFCIIATYPNGSLYKDKIQSTNYKCMLNVSEPSNDSENVNTLTCGEDGSFQFNFNEGIFFKNNFGIFGIGNGLTSNISTGDCMRVNK